MSSSHSEAFQRRVRYCEMIRGYDTAEEAANGSLRRFEQEVRDDERRRILQTQGSTTRMDVQVNPLAERSGTPHQGGE